MATLCKFPSFLWLSPHHKVHRLSWNCHVFPPPRSSTISASSSTRKSRKVKSNVELCNEIRDFVSEFGFPDGHVPSLKELSDHGRNDLANIVRRRGYKLIRDLLSDSLKIEVDGSKNGKCLSKEQKRLSVMDDLSTGQDEMVGDIVEASLLSSELSNIGDHSVSPQESSGDHRHSPVELLVNSLFLEEPLSTVENFDEKHESEVDAGSLSTTSYSMTMPDEVDKHLTEEESFSEFTHYVKPHIKDVSIVDNPLSVGGSRLGDDTNPSLLSEENPCSLTENSGKFLEAEASGDQRILEKDNVVNVSEDNSLPFGPSEGEPRANSSYPFQGSTFSNDNIDIVGITNSSLLSEKVAKFIQSGELDVIEDSDYGMLNKCIIGESQDGDEWGNEMEFHSRHQFDGTSQYEVGRNKAALAVNGTITEQAVSLGNDHLAAEDLATTDFNQDLVAETSKREKQVEINNLRFMLHQKELELSHLQQQIEREKLALSALQVKTETEIRKAQKLISDKDAELVAAEESLSGLVEVKIQYNGDGEVVEVAGSFNGWHHPIRLDPELSSTAIDSTGTRKSRLWSTLLWLYPGVYEIKFIVDSQWKIDPLRESLTRGGICNNVLRVDP